MLRREWTIKIPTPHHIAVELGGWLWNGNRILIDSQEIWRRPQRSIVDSLRDFLWGATGYGGFEHRFELDGLPCIIRVLHRLTHLEYELYVDGKLQ
jgi:hypothetical protein